MAGSAIAPVLWGPKTPPGGEPVREPFSAGLPQSTAHQAGYARHQIVPALTRGAQVMDQIFG